MFGWKDYEAVREQHQDRLRGLEKQRLIDQVQGGGRKPALWQSVGNLVARRNQKDRDDQSQAGYHLAEKSA
jgi:hypothetical protein